MDLLCSARFYVFVKCESFYYQYMLEKTRAVMQNGQLSETLATPDTGRRKTKYNNKHNITEKTRMDNAVKHWPYKTQDEEKQN